MNTTNEKQAKAWAALFKGFTKRQCYEIMTGNELTPEAVIACKRRIREINKTDSSPAAEDRIVKEYGIDGYVVRKVLRATNMEDAEKEFQAEHYIEPYHTYYDCTGRPFTGWHSIFNVNGKYVLYHRVSYDV